MRLATIETMPAGSTLTTERAVCDSLYFVLDGSARMKVRHFTPPPPLVAWWR